LLTPFPGSLVFHARRLTRCATLMGGLSSPGAPAGACKVGEIVKVPYVADYFFYENGDGAGRR